MPVTIDPGSEARNDTRMGWVEGPSERGTLGILVPCTITLLLCSWSVIQLNVPSKAASTARRLYLSCYWCLLGIFGPEIVIWVAWRQLLSAQALKQHFEDHKQCPKDFTVMHGFYAVMGGYVFDFPASAPESAFCKGHRRLTVTPKGVQLLGMCGLLPDVTKADIMDKSKVDEIGKVVTALQVSWMLVQILTRLVLRLPITLLEVTVLGHVFCAGVLTALWWYKPRKINEPTVLQGAWTASVAALFLMASKPSPEIASMLPGYKIDNGRRAEMASVKVTKDSQYVYLEERDDIDDESVHSNGTSQSSYKNLLDDQSVESLAAIQNRWRMAATALHDYPPLQQLLRRPVNASRSKYETALAAFPEMPERCRRKDLEKAERSCDASWYECQPETLVTICASDWPHDGLLRTTSGLFMGTILWAASIAFSAIHIAAWNAGFPSETEAWLWRVSAVYIGFSGLLWAFIHILAEKSARIWWLWYDVMIGEASKLVTVPLTMVCGLCGVLYLVARLYLILEGYIELRSLLSGSFNLPEGILAIPHVS